MSAPTKPEVDRRPTGSQDRQITVKRRDRSVVKQSAPSATTATDLYTVSNGYTAKGKIFLCERGAAAATFRIAIRKNGDALATAHYIAYDEALAANEATCTEELDCLDMGDVVTVYASSANLSFTFVGTEWPRREVARA